MEKQGFSAPRAGPQTWGTILGVKKLSSRETPGNKVPGAYAKNLPPASFLHAAGWRRRRRVTEGVQTRQGPLIRQPFGLPPSP